MGTKVSLVGQYDENLLETETIEEDSDSRSTVESVNSVEKTDEPNEEFLRNEINQENTLRSGVESVINIEKSDEENGDLSVMSIALYENGENMPRTAGAAVPYCAHEPTDMNIYQQKNTLAKAMMDLALFSANANQLRYILDSYDTIPYFYPSFILISLSIIGQVVIGMMLLWSTKYDVKKDEELSKANKTCNCTVVGIFFVTVINIFISVFGVADQKSSNGSGS